MPGKFAAWALAEMGNQGYESLVNALKSNNSIIRANAVSGLGYTKNPEALNYLLTTLHDKNTEVRLNSVDSIGFLSSIINDNRIEQGLMIALKDKNIGVQDTALFWIERNSETIDDVMIRALISTLKDFNREIRKRAADILENKTGKKYKWKRWWD
ncbi:MAG: HEAT repeat domain-containing protein [Candidatus Omnitrophota bacterium]